MRVIYINCRTFLICTEFSSDVCFGMPSCLLVKSLIRIPSLVQKKSKHTPSEIFFDHFEQQQRAECLINAFVVCKSLGTVKGNKHY